MNLIRYFFKMFNNNNKNLKEKDNKNVADDIKNTTINSKNNTIDGKNTNYENNNLK